MLTIGRRAAVRAKKSPSNHPKLDKAGKSRSISRRTEQGAKSIVSTYLSLYGSRANQSASLSRSMRSYCTVETPSPPKKQQAKQQAAQSTIGNLDIRVGRILEVSRHPDADSLYVERIDVGEAEPRTIISGLVKYMKEDELKFSNVLVICNLPAKAMRGVSSNGMLLAASTTIGEETKVQVIRPPAESAPGEKIVFEGEQGEVIPSISGNRLEKILKRCFVGEDGVPKYKTAEGEDLAFKTSSGVCSSALKNANIS